MKISHLLLSGALLMSILPSSVLAAPSKNDLQERITSLEKEVESINNSKNSLNANLEGVQQQIAETNARVTESQNKITALENQIVQLAAEMEKLNKEIKLKEKEIVIKQKELDEKKEILGQTLSFLYENKDVSFIEFFFQSGDLDEILNTFDFMKTIATENDVIFKEVQKQEQELKEQKEILETKKTTVEAKIKETEDLKLVLDGEKKVMDALLQQQKQQEAVILDQIIEAETKAQQAMAGIIASTQQIEEIARQEAAEAARQEEERKAAQRKNSSVSTPASQPSAPSYSSALSRPMASGTYTFTSPYGYRNHPIFNRQILHAGVDYAAPTGTPIYAAGSGKVVFAGPSPGFGNLVVILHANNLYTLYAHMYPQHIYVSAGQNVSAGEKIAGVGSAGNSTGPHLHFSVAEGRSGSGYNYVNPLNYVSR